MNASSALEYLALSCVPTSDSFLASFNSFKSGKEAAEATSYGGSLSGRYKVVEGDASLDRDVQSMFQDSYQYAMFSYHEVMLQYGGQIGQN